MTAITMTLQHSDWTVEGMTAGWADEETADVARACADSQYAYLILNTRTYMADQNHGGGWSFNGAAGTFTGPASSWSNIPDAILSLVTESIDFVVERIEEIRKEAAEQSG